MLMIAITMFSIPINAYDIPEEYYYISGYDSNLGNITIYIPYDDEIVFSLTDEGQPVLISSTNVTGYLSNTEDYTINFRPYYVGRYRQSYNYDYVNLNLSNIEYNIKVVDNNKFYLDQHKDIMFIAVLSVIGGVVCLIYMKR